jgi:hypothetical protein
MKRQPRQKLASSLILNYLSTFLKKLSRGYDKILMSALVKISLMVKYIEDNCQSLRSREKRISRQLMSFRLVLERFNLKKSFKVQKYLSPYDIFNSCLFKSRWVLKCLYQWGMEIDSCATFLYYRLHRTLLFLFNFVLNNFN